MYTTNARALVGMYALRERRQHVTQEDFEFAVAKVRPLGIRTLLLVDLDSNCSWMTGSQEEPGGQHVGEQALLVIYVAGHVLYCSIIFISSSDLAPPIHALMVNCCLICFCVCQAGLS